MEETTIIFALTAMILFIIIIELIDVRNEISSLRLMYGRHLTREMWKEAQPSIDAATTKRDRLEIKAVTLARVNVDIWKRTNSKNIYRDKLAEMDNDE